MGPDVPKETLLWQDPLPSVDYETIDDTDISSLKEDILAAPGLNVSSLVTTAWGAASSFRISDKRGGANGARIALEPQRSFAVNNPDRLETVLGAVSYHSLLSQTGASADTHKLEDIRDAFNEANDAKQVSLADLIVLGGNAAIEKAASDAGMDIDVPFTAGRVDATQENTDVDTDAYRPFVPSLQPETI